jgi:replicative superfamily II helicase
MGIHHAGMLRRDRNLIEDMFMNGDIKVLFSTATLAWGVNLPAYCVMIKGTKVYDAAEGCYKDVGIFDV